jgi:hypothetical protein
VVALQHCGISVSFFISIFLFFFIDSCHIYFQNLWYCCKFTSKDGGLEMDVVHSKWIKFAPRKGGIKIGEDTCKWTSNPTRIEKGGNPAIG